MKRSILRHKFALGLAAALLLASCSQDELAEKDTSLPAGKYPLELTAYIGEAIAAPATRGTAHGTWPYRGKLKIVSSIDQDEDNINWDLAIANDYGVSADGTVELFNTERYWKKSDEKLHIYAGASMLGMEGDRWPWSVRPDQSNETDLNASDYLTAYGILTFGGTHTLTFRHLTSKITVNLMQSDYLKAQDPESVEVTLGTKDKQWYIDGSFKGQPKEIWLEAEEGRAQTDVIIPYKNPNQTDAGIYATYEAVLIPQQITGTGKIVQIKVGDAIYNYTIVCSNEKFSGGENWIYNITVKENELDVSIDYKENISWGTDGNTGSGEVELP